MSLMLLMAAFLMFREFRQSLDEGIRFAKNRVLIAKFDPRLVQYDATRTRQFYEHLVERVRSVPGVQRVALTETPPLGLDEFAVVAFVPDGFQMPRDRESFASAMDTIDEGYFETLGIPILRGRGFRASDTADQPRVVVVNQQFARHYWPEGDAVGKHLRLERATGTPVEIVGVAQTIKYRSATERPTDFVYLPLAQHPLARMTLLVRSNGDPLRLVKPVKEVLRSLDANLPVLGMRTYEDLYRYHAVNGPRIAVTLVSILGALGLILAVAGLYGLVAYNVSRRTREIGIRMAIGARPSDILRLMMGKGLVLVGAGTTIGLAMGFALERLMKAVLFNAGGTDMLVYLVVVPSMLLATLLATYLPARRASRIAPTEALRYE
jgi:putative ABC transport system permease protein